MNWNEILTNEYAQAAIILLATYIGVRIVIYIVSKILPALTKKTAGDWDDKLVEKSSGPITWIAMIIGIRFATGQIGLGEDYLTTIEGMLITLIIIFAGILIYHILDAIVLVGFTNVAKKAKVKVNDSLIQFFHSILKFLVIVGVFLAVLASWGIEIGPLLAGLGVAGLAIAFALQNTLANVFGGISLLLDRTIQQGDLINLEDGTAGTVTRVGLRSTHINTFDNELVIIPNGKLADSNVKNIALPEPKTRVVVPFGVAYGSSITKTKKIVLEQIRKVKHIEKTPAPSIKFLEMADSSLNFKAYFYVNTYENKMTALDDANTKIYNALNKEGIEIPYPTMDLHLKTQPKITKKKTRKKK